MKNKLENKKYLKPLYIVLGIGFVFLLWWVVSLIVKATLLKTFPGPQDALPLFISLASEARTWLSLGATLLRLLISFTIAFVVGSLLGMIAGIYQRFESFMKPLIITLRTLPTAAVILILIVLVKPLIAPIVIVFLIIFPLSYEAMVSGFKNVDKELKEAAKIDGASRFQIMFKVSLPLSAPYILLGVVSSLGLGMKVAIMSEIITGSSSINGLGLLIHLAYREADITRIVALSIYAVILIGLIDLMMFIAKKIISKKNTLTKNTSK